MHAKTIQRVIDAKPRDVDLAEWLAVEMQRIDRINSQRSKFLAVRRELRKRHEQEMAEICSEEDAWTLKVQAECPHHDTVRYSDPSGGSDSLTACNTCNKEL